MAMFRVEGFSSLPKVAFEKAENHGEMFCLQLMIAWQVFLGLLETFLRNSFSQEKPPETPQPKEEPIQTKGKSPQNHITEVTHPAIERFHGRPSTRDPVTDYKKLSYPNKPPYGDNPFFVVEERGINQELDNRSWGTRVDTLIQEIVEITHISEEKFNFIETTLKCFAVKERVYSEIEHLLEIEVHPLTLIAYLYRNHGKQLQEIHQNQSKGPSVKITDHSFFTQNNRKHLWLALQSGILQSSNKHLKEDQKKALSIYADDFIEDLGEGFPEGKRPEVARLLSIQDFTGLVNLLFAP